MGIIDSLSAGFRLLGRRVEFLIIPILLDLFLWFAPRLSVAPLLNQIAAFYARSASADEVPDNMIELIEQVSMTFTAIGESSNLFESLASSSLLHVPSLLASSGSLMVNSTQAIEIEGVFSALALLGIFGLIGLLIGVIYLGLLAYLLPIGGRTNVFDWNTFVQLTLRQWMVIVGYIVLVVFVLMILYIPTGFILGLLLLLSPFIGSIWLFLMTGATMLLYFYLYFVTAGLILDNISLKEAILRSFRIVRKNFVASIGFIALSYLITMGFGLLLEQMAAFHAFSTLIAIAGNAYIGSGLALALLIFYRTRLLRMAGEFTGDEYNLVDSNSKIAKR